MTAPTSPFRVTLPDGVPMAFPATMTLDDIRTAAQGHADELGGNVEIVRFDGYPVETVRPDNPTYAELLELAQDVATGNSEPDALAERAEAILTRAPLAPRHMPEQD